MTFTPVEKIRVSLEFGLGEMFVGSLAIRERIVYFEYDKFFLDTGLNLSPIRLPFEPGLRTFDRSMFEGLPGVFNDSLPDGWGRLLRDRALRNKGILPDQLSPLDRLARVGGCSMGALLYEPDFGPEISTKAIDLDVLAAKVESVLDGKAENVLGELIALNGSSAGARPKAAIAVDEERKNIRHGKLQDLPDGYSHWLVKFPNTQDGPDAGAIEFVYALMAKEAGIERTAAHLFSAAKGVGYFATKRFDRDKIQRIHTHTVSGLLHADFRIPSLDYEDLLALTGILTRDIAEIEKMYRLAVFNVLSYNRDDHSKNFTFLMDSNGEWKLSPAYDLTFSAGPGGEQSTTVLGEGRNPGKDQLVKLGLEAKIDKGVIANIIEQTCQALDQWSELARRYGVSDSNIKIIEQKLRDTRK